MSKRDDQRRPDSETPSDAKYWHAESCPLHEIGESDCAYDRLACTCGWSPLEPT